MSCPSFSGTTVTGGSLPYCWPRHQLFRLRGSYSNLHYGYIENALVDLTGGVVTTVNLHSSPSDLLMAVKMAAETGSLMTCATPNGPTAGAQVMKNGLVSQHAYTVTGAEKIQYKRGWEEIIRLWNPWGKTEWRGRWGDRYGFSLRAQHPAWADITSGLSSSQLGVAARPPHTPMMPFSSVYQATTVCPLYSVLCAAGWVL
ncbi:hypothetical protein GHT09_018489 [Marmota monax]|uniref:Calpain catalytic domain-containing protein n=1 Tax=Marmota monax TaxID=9995 RepID=A0A834Q044_MARMO|nr:hypothetical protein GHT09_018489 [Marmota monax]